MILAHTHTRPAFFLHLDLVFRTPGRAAEETTCITMCTNTSTVQHHEESNDATVEAASNDNLMANQDDTPDYSPLLIPREYYFSNAHIQK